MEKTDQDMKEKGSESEIQETGKIALKKGLVC